MASCHVCDCWTIRTEAIWAYIFGWYRKNLSTPWPNPHPQVLLHCCCLVAKSCPTFSRPHRPEPTRILCPWDFPGKNAGEGCRFLLQRIFLIQGLNLHLLSLLNWVDSLPLSHQGSRYSDINKTQNPWHPPSLPPSITLFQGSEKTYWSVHLILCCCFF